MQSDVKLVLADNAWLRALRAEDVTDAYVDGLNDEVVHEFLVGPRAQRQTLESVKSFVASNEADLHGLLFGLFVDGTLRGTSRLHDIDRAKGTAYLGIALFDRTIWGRGWGRKMIDAICACAGENFALREVCAGIEEANVRSQRSFSQAGFYAVGAVRRTSEGRELRYWVRQLDAPVDAVARNERG
jgi:RimJ/RimL family protein N-acetyltransferase